MVWFVRSSQRARTNANRRKLIVWVDLKISGSKILSPKPHVVVPGPPTEFANYRGPGGVGALRAQPLIASRIESAVGTAIRCRCANHRVFGASACSNMATPWPWACLLPVESKRVGCDRDGRSRHRDGNSTAGPFWKRARGYTNGPRSGSEDHWITDFRSRALKSLCHAGCDRTSIPAM